MTELAEEGSVKMPIRQLNLVFGVVVLTNNHGGVVPEPGAMPSGFLTLFEWRRLEHLIPPCIPRVFPIVSIRGSLLHFPPVGAVSNRAYGEQAASILNHNPRQLHRLPTHIPQSLGS